MRGASTVSRRSITETGAARLALLIVTLVVVASAPAKQRPQPCPGGRFIVQAHTADDAPLGAVLVLDSETGSPGPSCRTAKLGLVATRDGTQVHAKWVDCDGTPRRLRLHGRFDEGCTTFDGVLTGRKVKRRFTAIRSQCGDGIIDAGNGEVCDGASGCGFDEHCAPNCGCVGNAGTGDRSWGQNGLAYIGNGGFAFFDYALDEEGGVVGVGATNEPFEAPSDAQLSRLLPGGQIDQNFGAGGSYVGGNVGARSFFRRVAVTNEGTIIVARGVLSPTLAAGATIERFTLTGARDPSQPGIIVAASCSYVLPGGLASLPDGRLLWSGNPLCLPDLPNSLIMFTPAGERDKTFGIDGSIVFPEDPPLFVPTPDGLIIVTYEVGPEHRFTRLLPNGAVDGTFGDAGEFTGPEARALAVDGLGRVLLSFEEFSGSDVSEIHVLRLSADGKPDEAFGMHGDAAAPSHQIERVLTIASDPLGRIIVGGFRAVALGEHQERPLVRRFLSDGTLDRQFGTDGEVLLPPVDDSVQAVMVQPDGKLLIGTRHGVVARLWP